MEQNISLVVKAICTVIDHFFSRREQHVEVVMEKANANFVSTMDSVIEHAPTYIEKFTQMIDNTVTKPEVDDEELPN